MIFLFHLFTFGLACREEPTQKPEQLNSEQPRTDAQALFLIPLSDSEESWHDLAYLATIPTSSHLNAAVPAVLAVADLNAPTAATTDLIQRLEPKTIYTLNGAATISDAETNNLLSAESAAELSELLVTQLWKQASTIVLASENDYAGAILASSLAALLDAPLLYTDELTDDDLESIIEELSTTSLIEVILDGRTSTQSHAHTTLNSIESTLTWVGENGYFLSYLTVSNTEDRSSGRAQKASLFAPIFAARHQGLSLPYAFTMPTTLIEDGATHPVIDLLNDAYATMGHHPDYLALVGAHDALPQTRKSSIFDNPIEEHPVSDLPYGELDDDPFLDLAIGRIVGDTTSELSNLATRTVNYEKLFDGNWEQNFIESGLWGFDELRSIMLNVGYAPPEHLSQDEISSQHSLEVAAVLHKDHSYCQVLGNAFDLNTETLLAPSLVLSRGCSVGGMDLLPSHQRSIVDHMLGAGAIAFVGASRNSIAHNTIIEVSMWNQLLAGQPLGKAFQFGINDTIVHWLDEQESSAFRYSLDIEMLYGDPAFQLSVPEEYLSAPAEQVYNANVLTVVPPEEWTMVQYHPDQLAEWNFEDELFMYTGAGASPKTYWSGSHDSEDMYFGVQLTLEAPPVDIQQQSEHFAPLGWGGSYYLDAHQDGSVTALWRVRLLDFDAYTGEIFEEAPFFDYQVTP